MSSLHYTSIAGRGEEIIDSVLAQPEITAAPALDFTLHLVLDELVSNKIYYAYPETGDGELTINIETKDDILYLTFIDKGVPFNPLEQEEPDITLPPEERPIGGLGIFLVKNMMDKVVYAYEDGCNILTVSKSTNQK